MQKNPVTSLLVKQIILTQELKAFFYPIYGKESPPNQLPLM